MNQPSNARKRIVDADSGHRGSPPHKFRKRGLISQRELDRLRLSQNDTPFETKRKKGLSRVGAPIRPNTRSRGANVKSRAQFVPESSPATPSSAVRGETEHDDGTQEPEELAPPLSAVVEDEGEEDHNEEVEEQDEVPDRVEEEEERDETTLRNEGNSSNDGEGLEPEHQQHMSPSAKPSRESDDAVEHSAGGLARESDHEDDRKSLAGYRSSENVEDDETIPTRDADLWAEKPLICPLMREFDKYFKGDLPLESAFAKRIAGLISEIRGQFEDANDNAADDIEGLTGKMHTSLEDLKAEMKEVIDKERDDKSERTLVVQFYAQLIPRLILLLYRAWQFHRATNGSRSEGPEQLIKVMDLVLQCYERVREAPARMIRGKGIVKPVKNYVVVPIRRLEKNLIRILDRRQREEKKQGEQKCLEEARRHSEMQCERQRRNNQQRIADHQRRAERMIERELQLFNGEPTVPRRRAPRETSARQEHALHEVDASRSKSAQGRRYRSHRTAESPRSRLGGQRVAERLGPWSAIEAKALVKALERHSTGDDRYQRIVDEECRVGGALEGRDMDDIFHQAKEFRAILEADYVALCQSRSRWGSESRPRLKVPPPWITNIS